MPNQVVTDQNTGKVRPSSAAFEDSPDGSPMSAIWENLHKQCGLDENDALKGHDGFGLASFTAGLARQLNQGIAKDPEPDQPAHVLVFGDKPKKSFSRKMAKSVSMIVNPS